MAHNIGKVGGGVVSFVLPTDYGTVDTSTTDLLRSVTNTSYDSSSSGGQAVVTPQGFLLLPPGAQSSVPKNNQTVTGREVPGTDGDVVYTPPVQQRAAQEGGLPGPDGSKVISTSLHDEVLGDGQANCLERAYDLAGPNDSVLMLDDKLDDSGHAVVRHADGSISDPNNPDKKYASIADYLKANSRYQDPIAVKKTVLDQILGLPPGPERDAMIAKLEQSGALPKGVANRMVADSGNDTYDLANAIANAPTYSPTEMALLSKIKDPEQRAIQELQMQMQKQALLCTVITNLAQMRHDMLKAVAQNLRS